MSATQEKLERETMFKYKKKCADLEKEVKKLRAIVTTAHCKKGCGDVEIGFQDYMHCMTCGEEMEGQISMAQFNYLKPKVFRNKES